jgi:formylglycine-generating enzyme required for sulfatase activity
MMISQTDTMSTCPRCGNETSPDWSFCAHCALPLETKVGEQTTLSDRIRYIQRESASRTKRERFSRWILSLSVMATFLLVVGGGIILFHPAFVPSMFQPVTPAEFETRIVEQAQPIQTEQGEFITEFTWIRIPAGEFMYGEPPDPARNFGGNLQKVDLDAFEILMYEVTNGQWYEYLKDEETRLRRTGQYKASVPRNWLWDSRSGEEPRIPFGLHDKPVVFITWEQAYDFCKKWLPRKLGCDEAFLPSSAQWEKAARGMGNENRYPWGNSPTIQRGGIQVYPCNVLEVNLGRPTEVGAYDGDKSPFGVYGMAGNVAEFVGVRERNYMAYKGGSFEEEILDAQIHIETELSPNSTFTWQAVGFRAARPAQDSE